MAFKMAFNKEELTGAPPVPAGWYTAQVKAFRPKLSKDKESVSLNAELAIIGNAEYEGRRFFAGLNTKMAWMWSDFVHATGLQMEEVQNENAGTEKADYSIPGVFEGADQYPDEPSKWKYQGPLTNATMEVELANIPPQNGYPAKNEVRQYKCVVPDCKDKHSTNLIKN